jgi:hypothetical protein
MVNKIFLDYFLPHVFFFLAVPNPIRFNSTCYPGILCDGTETDFYDCKYDRAQAGKSITDLFAIVTRCIGKIFVLIIF